MGLPQAGRDTLAEAFSDPQRATSLEEVQPSSLLCVSPRSVLERVRPAAPGQHKGPSNAQTSHLCPSNSISKHYSVHSRPLGWGRGIGVCFSDNRKFSDPFWGGRLGIREVWWELGNLESAGPSPTFNNLPLG